MSGLELAAIPKLMNLPPSSVKIYLILHERKSKTEEVLLSSSQLARMSKYSPRTVRYALRKLNNEKLVIKIYDVFDARKCYWTIHPMVNNFLMTR